MDDPLKPAIYAAVRRPHVLVLEYDYDATALDELHRMAVDNLAGVKVGNKM